MRYRVVLPGRFYSSHKDAFKGLLKKHRLAWKGSMDTFLWVGRRERVVAHFERDEARDVTVEASLTWEGTRATPFLRAFKAWAKTAGGRAIAPSVADRSGATADRELRLWEDISKPDAEALRRRGAPKRWIEQEFKAWKRRREAWRRDRRARG